MDVEAGQRSEGGEENGMVRGTNLPAGPSLPRRNAARDRRPPPKRLSYESPVMVSEEDQQKIER